MRRVGGALVNEARLTFALPPYGRIGNALEKLVGISSIAAGSLIIKYIEYTPPDQYATILKDSLGAWFIAAGATIIAAANGEHGRKIEKTAQWERERLEFESRL